MTWSGSAITAKDEGTNLTTALTSVFVGAGVTAIFTGGAVTVTIPGAVVREKLSAALGHTTCARTVQIATTGLQTPLAVRSDGAKGDRVISVPLDCNGQTITVQVGDGTGRRVLQFARLLAAQRLLFGNSGTPTNVVINYRIKLRL